MTPKHVESPSIASGAHLAEPPPRVAIGCIFYVTTRCQHNCAHCWLGCKPGAGVDMDPGMFTEIVTRAGETGLLKNVTLTGGEPFIDPAQLLAFVRRLVAGTGVLEIFIPTNGIWVLDDNYLQLAEELAGIAQFIPYELRIAWSMNPWNIGQLGRDAKPLARRWQDLEDRFPEVFRRRRLVREDMLALGRAAESNLACPGPHVGSHCNFDDWVDPARGIGFYSDFLAFWPDGSVRVCYMAGPTVGHYQDDYPELLDKRARFLWQLREQLTGSYTGTLSASACTGCALRIPTNA